MKILQVIPYFSWSYGGPVRVVWDLAHKLAERNHEVTIFTTDVGPTHRLASRDKIRSNRGVDVRYFRCLNNCAAQVLRLQISPQMRTAFSKELKNFDIVHSHEARGFHNIYVRHYARKYGIPYVLQAHGALPKTLEQQKRIFILAKHIFDAIIGERAIRDASRVIALTQSEAIAYEKLGVEKGKIVVIPNGLDLSHFETLPKRGAFREKYGIARGERIILFLARIHKTKGLELLLRAFSGVKNEIDNVRLVIVGPDGGYLARLRADIDNLAITDNVLLTGPLYAEEKLEAYIDADVFVLPSSYDAFPLSPIEACMCGIPIIVTNRCGVADAVKEAGIVVDYNTRDLQIAMYNVINNTKLQDEMRKKGPIMVRNRYDIEKIVDDVEKLYRTCL